MFEDGAIKSSLDIERIQKEISSIKLFAIDGSKLNESGIKEIIREFEVPNKLDGIVVIADSSECAPSNVCLEVGIYWNRNERIVDYMIQKEGRDWVILERVLRK